MIGDSKLYYISEHSGLAFFHGGIGYVDIERILFMNNALPVTFPYHFEFSMRAKIARLAYLVKMCHSIKAGSVIVFQHPVNARMNKLLLRVLRFIKKVLIVCIVADIDGLKGGNNAVLLREINFFRRYKYFILHNPNMYALLRSFHPDAICTFLECFDFLAKCSTYRRSKTGTVVFAGNLQKSRFLEKLEIWLDKSPTLQMNLYGPYISDAMLISKNVLYKGLHHPYLLPDLIEGSFGLIWDGEGLAEPSGSLGRYMKYISHHKLSLYIVCNLPVIVYENAGSAELVKKLNIGFTVSSLFEIEDKINELSETEYDTMVHNSYNLAKEITSGNNLQKALSGLLMKARQEADLY